MSVASTWLDIVVALDIHVELVPTPVPTPTPFPHPHCSIIWDPVGAVVGEMLAVAFAAAPGQGVQPAGPVLIDGTMATVVGDPAAMPVPHIILPPGVAFAVGLPPSDAELCVGSQTVTLRGSSAVRMGEVALSCSDPLPLPTGAVVHLPKGPFVTTIGGPPALSVGSATPSIGGRPPRTQWSPGALAKLAAKAIPERLARARRLLPKAACFFTGHPVNVATGGVTTSAVDFVLPGPIPLRLERDYDSNWFDRRGPLGHGWSCTLDSRVWLEAGRVVLLVEDGREIELDARGFEGGVMRKGDEAWHPVERLTLRALGHHRWEVTDSGGLRRHYGPVAGEPHDDARRGCSRLLAIEDRAGHRIAFEYDAQARLAEIVDTCGRRVAFEHDAADRLRRVFLPAADGDGHRQHVEYRYDDRGDLVQVTDASGQSTRFEYDGHLLVRETDRNGQSFYFVYDGHGRYARCTRTWGDGGVYDHVIAYDREGRTTIVTNSLGETTTYAMNPLGCVTSIGRPSGATIEFEYDDAARLLATTDELGHVTRHEYDARGNQTRTQTPDGAQTITEHDALDQRVRRVEPTGATWAWEYDRQGNVIVETDALGAATHFRYEGGQLVAIVDPAGETTRLSWTAQHDLIEVAAPDGSRRQWRYDALGRVVQAADAGGNVRARQYDALGRVVRVEEPDGNVTELAYDGEGNVVRVRGALRDVTTTWSGAGQPTSRTVGGTTVRRQYDTEGQLVAAMDAAGRAHRFEREPGGEVVAEIAFDGLTRRYALDAAGRVTAVIHPGVGRHSTIERDPMGRPIAVDHADGGFERYAWDDAGRLVRAENQDAIVELVRDAAGRVVEERTTVGDETWTVHTARDHAGRRTGLRSSLGADVTVERDASGAITRLAQHGAKTAAWEVTLTRNALGQEVDRQLPGGARSYWFRDALGRAEQQWVGRDQTMARQRRHEWRPGDRPTRIEDSAGKGGDLHYDARGALVKAARPDGPVEARGFDEAGNLFDSPERTDREYGEAGQILTRTGPEGVTSYRYDERGNLAGRIDPDGGEWRFHFDDADRLVQVDRPDATGVAMTYDALGRRLSKSHAGRRTRWVWDGDARLHEWEEADEPVEPRLDAREEDRVAFLERSRATLGALHGEDGEAHFAELLAEDEGHARAHAVVRARQSPPAPASIDETVITWLHGNDPFTPLARLTASSAHAIVADHLGTPIVLMDDAGEVALQLTHDLHGRAHTQGEAKLCPHRFPGQYRDEETGLHDNRHRVYDPETGTYLSRDPLGLRGGLRPYAYPADPVSTADPLGLAPRPSMGSGCASAPGLPRVGLPLHDQATPARPELAEALRGSANEVVAFGDVGERDPLLDLDPAGAVSLSLPSFAASEGVRGE